MSLLDEARRERYRRELRYLFWGWTLIGSIGATIGAIYGWLHVDNDDS